MKFSVGHRNYSSCGVCAMYSVSIRVVFARMKQLKYETDFLTFMTSKVKNMYFVSIFLLCLLDTVYRFCMGVNVQSTLG
jgi:hypothetical protein